MADVTYIPDANNGNQMNNWLPWMLAGNGGFGGFGGGWGTGIVGFILGALVGNNGFGGLFGGNSGMGGAGYVANALNNDTGRELILQAVNGNHEALSNLSGILHADVASVQAALNTISLGIQNVGSQVGMSGLQVQNAILSGDASITSKLQECCCENRLAICQQTSAIQSDIAGVNQNIAANRAAQQLSDCQQTYALTDTMNRGFLALDNKIDALESSRKDREITSLTAKVAQLESQNFTTGVVGSAVAPVNAALSSLAREVDDIKCKLPSTVNVQYPNLYAVNATPYVSGGYYQGGFNGYYGGGVPGFGGNIYF